MKVLEEYQGLYTEDFFIADMFGGRGGGRSYALTQHALYELLHSHTKINAFFLRQIHADIYDSMWKDFLKRIEEYEEMHEVDLSEQLEWTNVKSGANRAVNKLNGSSIATKGFKVSSGNQEASLKSLSDATHLYIEEANEVEEEDFNKVSLSLRKKDAKLKIIRAFNPPSKAHWIWKDYNLNVIKNEEIVKLLSFMRGEDDEIIKRRLEANAKEYHTAVPKSNDHIAMFTNYANNQANLNKRAFDLYEKFYNEDLDYYLVAIAGLIPSAGGQTVYYRYDEHKHHTDRVVQPDDVLHIGMDFNITNMSAVIHVVDDGIRKAVAEETKIFDTYQMCGLLKEKYHKHRIIVYPDATGASRKTSSGKSDHDIIREHGFAIKCDAVNPPVRNRVNTLNTAIHNEDYLVNRHTCPEYSLSLKQLRYKNGVPDKASGYDHLPDAGGYFVAQDYESRKTRRLIFRRRT